MFKESFHGVINWVAGTGASVSLALFVFTPTITAEKENLKTIALCLILFSIPLFVATCIQIKDIQHSTNSNKGVDQYLGIHFILGCLSLGAGFTLLCFSIALQYGVAIALSTLLVLFLWRKQKLGKTSD